MHYAHSPKPSRRDDGRRSDAAAGHAGPADSESRVAGPVAWLRRPAAHRADYRRRAARRAGRALPRAGAARAPGAARRRVGHLRQQPAREVLSADRRRPAPAQDRQRAMGPPGAGHVPSAARGRSVTVSWARMAIARRGLFRRRQRRGGTLRRDPVPHRDARARSHGARHEPGGRTGARHASNSDRSSDTRKKSASARGLRLVDEAQADLLAARGRFAALRDSRWPPGLSLALGIGANTLVFSLLNSTC